MPKVPQVGESRLNPGQRTVIETGLLASGFNCVLQMPTGSGKTWLAEQAIAAVLDAGHRAVYLTPLRALANELGRRWTKVFGSRTVGVFTGETLADASHKHAFLEARLLIMTPERLDACIRSWRSHWAWLPEVGLLVVDELHLLGDPQRGPRLEGTIGRIRRLNPMIQILGLSATLGNRSVLADWLGGLEYGSDWRAVPLTWRVRRFRRADEKPRLLLEEISACFQKGGRSLAFVQSRRRAEQLAGWLSSEGIETLHHHAGLDARARQHAEEVFRVGEIAALVSTGTLEMGLNLPVRQVVLYDLQAFDGNDYIPLSVNTVWQRAGRAGRPGLDPEGEVVLLAPTWDKSSGGYEKGRFEPVRSGLGDSRALAEQLLTEVASGLCGSEAQLVRTLETSLAAFQKTIPPVRRTLRDMLEAGMLAECSDDKVGQDLRLKATRLGRIAVRQMLAPESVLHLSRLTREDADEFSFFDLLLCAANTPDCEPLIPADFEELDALGSALAQERSQLLEATSDGIRKRLGVSNRRLLAVLKTALIARRWTRSGDPSEVAREFGCYPFEVKRLSESLTRLLTALVGILRCPSDELFHHKPALLRKAQALLAMVRTGLDDEAVTLTFLPGIGATLARRLVEAGIGDLEALAQAEIADIEKVPGISATRAEALILEAEKLLPTHATLSLNEDGPTLAVSNSGWPADLDPYRLGRARRLRVNTQRPGRYEVSGGLEPHRVALDREGKPACDCPDYRAGHACKHTLAVRLARGDAELQRLVAVLEGRDTGHGLDLHQLWFQ